MKYEEVLYTSGKPSNLGNQQLKQVQALMAKHKEIQAQLIVIKNIANLALETGEDIELTLNNIVAKCDKLLGK